MKVLISGSSGLVGTALMKSLQADGHQAVPLPRSFDKPLDLEGVAAVIHLAGESIAQGRWSAAKKQRIEESRVEGTRNLSEQLATSEHKPSVFICASAIGFYGDRGESPVDEGSPAGVGFLARVCQQWEAATEAAALSGIRTVCIRTGIVLSKHGGALKQMLPPFRMGGGGILGSGRQYMSWISLADEIKAIRFAIENETLRGPVNLVSPHPVTNLEFTQTLGKVLHRPVIMPLPAFAARLIFGEMADALLLSGARVIPKKLMDAGYEFCHADLQSALEDALQ